MNFIPASRSWLPHRSPGITAIYNELKSSSKNRILDLGASSGASFAFFAHLSCKIRFENLNDFFAVTEVDRLTNEQVICHLDRYLSCFDADEKFDVVLTWDIFDYLDLPVIEWLIKRLSLLFTPTTLLHSVRSVSRSISPTPRAFQIIDQYQINVEALASEQIRQHPCHHTAQLLKHLPHCYMENSYLNYDGMVPGLTETVMRYQPTKLPVARRQASDELARGKHYSDKQSASTWLAHRSYALEPIFNRLTPRTTILDLGLKNKNNSDFFYRRTPNIYADNMLATLSVPQNKDVDGQLKTHVLNFSDDTVFDAIFFWDILNFLSAEDIATIFDRLAPHISSHTEIHVILYSGKTKPNQPQQFQITSAQTVEILATPRTDSATTLSSSGLLKATRIFQLRDTFVFREGMQRGIYEYILTRHPSFACLSMA